MKAVLVIDVDDDMIGEVDYTVLNKKEMVNGRAELIPLLKQFTMDDILMAKDVKTAIEMRAYNDCLEEITGETELVGFLKTKRTIPKSQ